ncbi:hypothetical protein GCM10027592_62850 [Spirosoma flavus]
MSDGDSSPVDHRYDSPPDAVKVVLFPSQTVKFPVMVNWGLGSIVMVEIPVAEHPAALVTVTLYDVDWDGLMEMVSVVALFDHR